MFLQEEPMAASLINDRGRGPEITGTRITVFNLLPYFLDPTVTEASICQIYQLAPAQVAAARAYVLNNADTVLEKHLEIEQRIAEGNSPEVVARAKLVHSRFQGFRQWLSKRQQAGAYKSGVPVSSPAALPPFPTYHEWLSENSPVKAP
jgi:uncharacterized protein (DUF433 family)